MIVKTIEPTIRISRGEGAYVFDAQGRRYLDMYGGHAVCSVGHAHPRLAAAIAEQARRLTFYSTVADLDVREEAAKALTTERHPYVFFVNSGAEAVENALKLAGGSVVSFKGCFHGRTAGAWALKTGATHEFGEVPALDGAAGVIVEPIQSLAGVRTAPAEFFVGLRDECDRVGALLIYDEVQTGAGRTGTKYFAGRHGVWPDVVCLAKGIAGGFPAGAVLMTEAVAAKVKIGDLGSTFGGGPLASAAICATASILEEERLPQNAAARGSQLKSAVGAFGEGLLLGVRARPGAVGRLLEAGILVGGSANPEVIRLLPPLVITKEQCDVFAEAFHQYA